MLKCNCIYIVMSNGGWNNNVAVKIVACWNWNIYYIFMTRYSVSLSLLYTLDVSHSTGGNPARSTILWVSTCRPISSVKVNQITPSRTVCRYTALTYSGKIGISQVIVKKNKLTDFIASVSEAVSGIFLPPPKLRPQKNITMFTNRNWSILP